MPISKKSRRLTGLTAASALALATTACGDFDFELPEPKPVGCFIAGDGEEYNPNGEQAYYAATIAAVGARDEMPERAIVIALATAWQESSMKNIEYGDRDSVGLFQQRPSQGWGTAEELQDPVYASNEFYRKLVLIDGWDSMTLTEAAQAVQISGHPDKYAKWETESTDMAEVFAEGRAEGIACTASRSRYGSTDTAELAAEYQSEWQAEGAADGRTIRFAVPDETRGWSVANWAVTRSTMYAVESVTYAGKEWRPGELEWADVENADASQVAVTLLSPEDQPSMPENGESS
ncbi:hypothetical protein [Salininema proteolyticum]|uniref:Secreted protein n=1 Tax=Salininema proteolyticum TaxID=1607685 RepID=A0ABV8TVT8_9ACTN